MSLCKKIALCFYFILINITCFDDTSTTPFLTLVKITVPYDFENEKIKLNTFILISSIVMVFVILSIERISNQFHLGKYVFIRSSKTSVMWHYLKDIIKYIGKILLLKVFSDAIFFQINGIENILVFFKILVSYIVTLMIWICLIYCLFLFHCRTEIISFVMITVMIISQYYSQKEFIFSLLSIGSPFLFSDFELVIGFKFLMLIFLLSMQILLFKKYEDLDYKNQARKRF